jgi:hypothetical protein
MPEPYNPGAVARAITAALISPNEADSNGEPANVVDGLFAIARAIAYLADRVGEAPAAACGQPGRAGHAP